MADDTAEFLLSLKDQVSGPATAASAALKNLMGQMKATGKAGDDMFKTGPNRSILDKAREGLASKGVLGKSAKGGLLAAPDISKFMVPQLSVMQRVGNGLKAAWAGWGKEGKRAAQDIEGASRHLNTSGGFMRRATEFAAGTLLADAARKTYGFAKSIASSTVGMAAFGQSAEASFAIFGSEYAADGAKVFEHIDSLSNKFGLDLQLTTDRYKDFLSLGMNPDQADDIVKATADMRALGASTETVDSALSAMMMVRATGVFDTRTIRSLARAGIGTKNVMRELAATTGLSVDELKTKLKSGGIEANKGLEAILNAVKGEAKEGNLGEVGEKWADTTLEGMWGKLKSGLASQTVKAAKIMTPVFIDTLSGWLKDFTKFAESDTGKKFFTDLAVGLRDFTKGLVEALPTLTRILEITGHGFSRVVSITGAVTEGGVPREKGEAPLTTAQFNEREIGGLKERGIFGSIALLWQPQAKKLGQDVGQGLADGLASKDPILLAAGQRAGQSVISGIASPEGVDAHSPSRKGAYLGQMTGIGFGMGFGASMNTNAVLAAGLGANVVESAAQGAAIAPMALPAPSFEGGLGGTGLAAGAGGNVVHLEVNLYGVEGDPEKTAAAAKRGTLDALGDAFGQLELEAS